MDKLNIEEVYIRCSKNIADGRIKEFFRMRGVGTSNIVGDVIGRYYFSYAHQLRFSVNIPENRVRINPWKKSYRKFPREMMVSNHKDGGEWKKRMVIAKTKLKFPFVAIAPPYLFDDDYRVRLTSWLFAKEIE